MFLEKLIQPTTFIKIIVFIMNSITNSKIYNSNLTIYIYIYIF